MRKKNEIRSLVACLATVLALSVSSAMAGTDMKEITPPATGTSEKDWTVELASGSLFSNVRDPAPVEGYTLIPIVFTASLKLDDVGLDNYLGGWLRGYSEFYFSGGYYQIVSGPEDHFEGIMVGPRYNFVQPGWKIVPFIGAGVGIGFINSRPQFGGMGEDFNFSFEVSAGAKYLITDDWFLRLAIEYKHISNAGMSEPTNPNNPIDALGPQLSVGYAF
jgi:opacity protein-like surface antigen